MSIRTIRRHLATIVPSLAAGALVVLSAAESHATAQMVGQVSFNRLCPQLIGGDDEFNGNGPDVESQVTLRRGAGSASNDSVLLDIYMHEMETRSDWTEGEIRRTMTLGVAPSGRHFTQIWAPGPTGAYQWTPLGTNPTYGTATVAYVDTDTTLDRFYNPQWWVSEIDINGDTAGGDVGGCGSDDSYMNVRLPAIWFWY